MLKVHNLMKEYDGQPVLEGVSFQLASGERVGLVGANGSRLAGPRPSGIWPRRPTGRRRGDASPERWPYGSTLT